MDVYEATRIVLSRIQSLDPANASKIMGLLLLQDHGEKEMIRLAFGPQNLLHSVIAKAKAELDLGFGWGHCSYLCKNGGTCKFPHGDGVGSPMMENCNELLRSMSVPPRLAHQFTGGSRLQQRELAQRASLMMGDDLHKFGRWTPERIDLSASRHIYLTFPADSIFREEDVSNYFSTYGPVQDVRIPYQQKRMFGFVTFVYPETVKIILAKGNPHFVCDSRVLVKPYKEKGKVPDKYRSKPSPDGTLDSRDIMDLQLVGRAFHENTQDVLWKRRFEERVLELQSRRLMNLQLPDVKKHFQPNHTFGQTLVSPRLGNSLSPLPANQTIQSNWYDEDDTVKLPESFEDRLPDSPFASPTHHFLDTNGSSLPCFENDETTTSTLSDSVKPFNCQTPSLSLIGMLPGSGGSTCRVGI